MNFVTAELVQDGGPAVSFAGYKLSVPPSVLSAKPGLDGYFGREVILGIRPSDFEDATLADASWPRMQVSAGVTEELGSEIHVIFTIDAPPVEHASIAEAAKGDEDEDETAVALAGGKSLWTARVAARSSARPGSPVELAVDTSNLHFFDLVSGLSIGHPQATPDKADEKAVAG
jgi:multiple sugar transport system ATP-binding protein